MACSLLPLKRSGYAWHRRHQGGLARMRPPYILALQVPAAARLPLMPAVEPGVRGASPARRPSIAAGVWHNHLKRQRATRGASRAGGAVWGPQSSKSFATASLPALGHQPPAPCGFVLRAFRPLSLVPCTSSPHTQLPASLLLRSAAAAPS
jgi:hypothetical protein